MATGNTTHFELTDHVRSKRMWHHWCHIIYFLNVQNQKVFFLSKLLNCSLYWIGQKSVMDLRLVHLSKSILELDIRNELTLCSSILVKGLILFPRSTKNNNSNKNMNLFPFLTFEKKSQVPETKWPGHSQSKLSVIRRSRSVSSINQCIHERSGNERTQKLCVRDLWSQSDDQVRIARALTIFP